MSNTPCQERRRQRRPFLNKFAAIVALVSVLGLLSVHAGVAPAYAAAATPPQMVPSVDQFGHPVAQTTAEHAYTADKVKLADEYIQQERSGKETLATFETHYRAFMLKWHLGNVANLHTVLTRSAARLQSTAAKLTRPQCPSVAAGQAVLCSNPVGAAQFPEEKSNWCGPATLATTVVENSFAWPGANTYNGVTMGYDRYKVSQPAATATNDELWLAQNGVIEPDPNNPNWLYQDGSDAGRMLTMVNHFANGHGGNYAYEPLQGSLQSQITDFQGKVSSDIGTGWDVPTGIYIPAYSGASMPGYPVNYRYVIAHLVPVTFISSDLNTTYYSDPVYNAPDYSGWDIKNYPPYESTPTSNIVWWGTYILW